MLVWDLGFKRSTQSRGEGEIMTVPKKMRNWSGNGNFTNHVRYRIFGFPGTVSGSLPLAD
ncbi:hypothetical protein BDW71DRAFT_180372 [Aspergillus fruticulosus]